MFFERAILQKNGTPYLLQWFKLLEALLAPIAVVQRAAKCRPEHAPHYGVGAVTQGAAYLLYQFNIGEQPGLARRGYSEAFQGLATPFGYQVAAPRGVKTDGDLVFGNA